MKAKECEGAPDTLEIDWKNKSKMDFLEPLLIPVNLKRLSNVCINTYIRLQIFCYHVVISYSIAFLIIIIITCCYVCECAQALSCNTIADGTGDIDSPRSLPTTIDNNRFAPSLFWAWRHISADISPTMSFWFRVCKECVVSFFK